MGILILLDPSRISENQPLSTQIQQFPLVIFSLVQFSCSVVSDSLQPHGLQHARLPCPSPTPGACANSCPLSRWCHPTIYPLLSPSPPAFHLSQHQGLFQWVSSSHQVAKVLELQLVVLGSLKIFLSSPLSIGCTENHKGAWRPKATKIRKNNSLYV